MMNGKRGRARKIFLTLVILIGMSLGYWLYASIFKRDNSIPEDKLARVTRGNLARSVVATGKIQPLSKVDIKSKSSGIIKYLYADEGDRVKSGQILIELDKEMIQAQLREAEASLLAVKARLQEVTSQKAGAEAELSKLQVDLETTKRISVLADREFERRRGMLQQRLISQSEMDTTENQLIEAQQSFKSLESQILVKRLSIEAAAKAILKAEAEVAQAQAVVQRQEENLGYTTIRSPMDGIVLSRPVEVGDAVSSILQLGSNATLIMTMADMSQVFVEGRVDENDIGKVSIDQTTRITVDTFRDRKFEGRVIKISPLGTEKDNVIGFKVKVSILNDSQLLRVNMSANAEIILEEKKDVLLIPEAAVIYDKKKATYAEVPERNADRGRRQIPVRLGISNGTYTEITEGLKEKDAVILQ